MNLDSFTGPGSTPSRRRFWDKVTQAVIASQKIEGKNVSVDEHQGMGTIINVSNSRKGGGPCFTADNLQITFAGITADCGCLPATVGTGSFSIIENNLNDVFTLPLAFSGTGWVDYQDTFPSLLKFSEYGASNDCSTSNSDNYRNVTIDVYCTDGTNGDPAGTYVYVFVDPATTPPSSYSPFHGNGATGATSFTNDFTACSEEVTDGVGFDELGMAHGGTATIVEL